jgi:hypothetical protein
LAALAFAVVSFVIAQIVVVTLNNRATRSTKFRRSSSQGTSIGSSICKKSPTCKSPTPSKRAEIIQGRWRALQPYRDQRISGVLPEIKSYIERVRTNFHQPEAFEEFDDAAHAIERDTRFAPLVEFAKTMCVTQPEGRTQP